MSTGLLWLPLFDHLIANPGTITTHLPALARCSAAMVYRYLFAECLTLAEADRRALRTKLFLTDDEIDALGFRSNPGATAWVVIEHALTTEFYSFLHYTPGFFFAENTPGYHFNVTPERGMFYPVVRENLITGVRWLRSVNDYGQPVRRPDTGAPLYRWPLKGMK